MNSVKIIIIFTCLRFTVSSIGRCLVKRQAEKINKCFHYTRDSCKIGMLLLIDKRVCPSNLNSCAIIYLLCLE